MLIFHDISRLTLQVLASYGVFVVKNDQFSVDLEEVNREAEAVFEVYNTVLQNSNTSGSNQATRQIGTLMGPLAANCIKKLDRVVTETAGCDSFIQVLLRGSESLINAIPEKTMLRESLVKKFRLVSANAWLKLGDYEKASTAIELCCAMINKGEKDELKVYFLAFKMHCQLRDKEEAIETFQQIFSASQVSAEPILECFNVLVQCQLFDVALGLGGHLLKACEKFIVDPDMKKRFLLKFLFVFDLAVSQTDSTENGEQNFSA